MSARPEATRSPRDTDLRKGPARDLIDLMSDGFYALLLMRRGQMPMEAPPFIEEIRKFLAELEASATRAGIANEDIHAAKYAYCALVDETVLGARCGLHAEWERRPLQLLLFGDHLAGEHFFIRLDELRAEGASRLQALKVYYFCLLLGFQGKYRVEGTEKLHYLTARLGDEVTFLAGKRTGFAPHWAPPDRITHTLRRIVPPWVAAAALAGICLLGYFGFRHALSVEARDRLNAYHDVIQAPAEPANITITLP